MKQNKWIDINKTLPPVDTMVLVIVRLTQPLFESGVAAKISYEQHTGYILGNINKWVMAQENAGQGWEPIEWQPLPDFPEKYRV